MDHQAQPDDPHRGNLPLRLFRRRVGSSPGSALQRWFYGCGGDRWGSDVQPRRTNLYGYGITTKIKSIDLFEISCQMDVAEKGQ